MEDLTYLQRELITCIGNKRGLLPLISAGVQRVKARLGKTRLTFLDLFAGSGVVSRFMKAHAERIVANDLERYAQVVNACYLSNRSALDWEALRYYEYWLRHMIASDWRRGFIAELYAPLDDARIAPGERVFYTRRNAEYIDTARQHIEQIPAHLQGFFLAPLIVKASIHNNTGGIFKGFYKNRQGLGAFGGEGANALTRILGNIELQLPTLSRFVCDVLVTQQDALQLSASWPETFDLVYLDPPYNQHPYGSNYFMLNLIATYERPLALSRVSGIPRNWTRSPFNSAQLARQALRTIIGNLKTNYVLISYNSEGFMCKEDFMADLHAFGTLTLLEAQYNAYRASRNLVKRSQYVTEYLFLLERQ